MTEIFMYIVSGKVFTDNTAWGEAWKAAQAEAEQQHTFITRKCIKISDEVYVGSCFLRKDTNVPPYIF